MDETSFFSYFKWLCKENNFDDIKKLIATFHFDQNYIRNLLRHVWSIKTNRITYCINS